MDLNTGRVYESREAAIAAGVNPADLVAVERTPDGGYRLSPEQVITALGGIAKPKYQPHQGTREMARRANRKGR